jgi:O-Antigen ligase
LIGVLFGYEAADIEDFRYGAIMRTQRGTPTPAKAVSLQAIKAPSSNRISATLWQQFFVFLVGFSIQFNVLIGGSGGGALETGTFGYRFSDYIALGAFGLLCLYALAPQRLLPLGVFGLFVAALFFFAMLSPDPRTSILAKHYILYSLAGIYVAMIVNDQAALSRFCWGLILGGLATVPIFSLESAGYSSALIDWGLVPGYSHIFAGLVRSLPRYSGLSGHPNEAGHVAALSAAAGAYFAYVQRRYLPLALAAGSILLIFYYTWSRGGLVAGGVVLFIPFLFSRGRTEVWRLPLMIVSFVVVLVAITQFDFVISRFEDDPNVANNIAGRIDSTTYALGALLSHPFGTSMEDFYSIVGSGTGGTSSAHNGFLFFGGIFGVLPLLVLLTVFLANFIVRDETDIFFAFLTLQVSLSYLFEQLSGSYSYAFITSIMMSRLLLKTRLGALFQAPLVRSNRLRKWGIPPRSGTPSLKS